MPAHVQPVEMSEQASESGITAPNIADGQPMTPAPSFDAQTVEVIPEPLRRYLSHNLMDIPWHHVSEGIEELRLQVDNSGYRVSLVRLKPGSKIPTHTHTKEELTVILAGGYTDGDAHFERGDFCLVDASTTHSPVADPDAGCLALGVLSGPIELTGLMGSLLNPLLRF
jgi:putative transcriptional regulator